MEVDLEVTAPFGGVTAPPRVERLACRVLVEGDLLGIVELPICDGGVPAAVLADAVAAELAWEILRRFFERTLYPALPVRDSPEGIEVWRGKVRLAGRLPAGESLHDAIGWLVFLQELWGKPEWPDSRFYGTTRDGRRPGGGSGSRSRRAPVCRRSRCRGRPGWNSRWVGR